MVLNKKQKSQLKIRIINNRVALLFFLITIITIGVITSNDENADFLLNVASSSSSSFGSTTTNIVDNVDIDEKCKNLPLIRPSGVFFLDGKVQNVQSADGISPKFQLGSYLGDKVRYHMTDDVGHFSLFQEYFETSNKNKGGGLAFDMGANQGFFTYYLAALGMNVHSFEIANDNFVALMHGRHFNTKSIADRVNLYPMGLDNKVSRFSLNGANYEGFLKDTKDGPILGML